MAAGWYRVLEAARRLRDGFAASDLSARAGVAPHVASAWLGKFCRWGYASRTGTKETQDRDGARRKPRTLYALTDLGRSCEFREGMRSRLARLVAAVRAHERAGSKRERDTSYSAMLKVCGEVEGRG